MLLDKKWTEMNNNLREKALNWQKMAEKANGEEKCLRWDNANKNWIKITEYLINFALHIIFKN